MFTFVGFSFALAGFLLIVKVIIFLFSKYL
jgi:hypothetical protein